MDNRATSITAVTPVNVAVSSTVILSYYEGALMSREDCIKGLSWLGLDNLQIIEQMDRAEEIRLKTIKTYGYPNDEIKIGFREDGRIGPTLFRVYNTPSSQKYAI